MRAGIPPTARPALTSLVLAVALLLSAGAAAAQVVEEYEYRPDAVYQVRAGLGLTTQVVLAEGEQVLDFSVGFASGWDVVRRDNVFYLRPKDVDADTNLVVRTDAHAYIFELKVVATDWRALDQARQAGVHYKVGFRYPGGRPEAPARGAVQSGAAARPTRFLHANYDFAARRAPDWLVPASVHDDGRFTYVRMGELPTLPTGTFPAVFARDSQDGRDFIVNTSVEGSTIVVHGTYRFLVVRHGDHVVGLRRNAGP